MGAVTYPNEQVSRIIRENFIPVQINIVDHPEFIDRFHAHWTPTLFIIDPEGVEHKRQWGYTLPEQFVPDLLMGLAYTSLDNKHYEEADKRFQRVVDEYPDSFDAPEALYMVGVSKYRTTDDGNYLEQYWNEVMERYPDSRWAQAGDI
jgi:hypothetical protein